MQILRQKLGSTLFSTPYEQAGRVAQVETASAVVACVVWTRPADHPIADTSLPQG
jgi:hypothetical protein